MSNASLGILPDKLKNGIYPPPLLPLKSIFPFPQCSQAGSEINYLHKGSTKDTSPGYEVSNKKSIIILNT